MSPPEMLVQLLYMYMYIKQWIQNNIINWQRHTVDGLVQKVLTGGWSRRYVIEIVIKKL